MGKEIITSPEGFKIKPHQINTKRHFWSAFGNNEKEVSALWIVRFCQKRKGWFPFTIEELKKFCGEGNFHEFNGLDKDGYFILKEGKYHITKEFVENCFNSSPAE